MARPRKLNAEQLGEIREWARAVKSLPTPIQMAAKYGVSRWTIDRLFHGYDPARHTVAEFDAARANGEFCTKNGINGLGAP